MPPMKSPKPTTPFKTIIKTANIVSRPKVEASFAPNITAATNATSIITIDNVSTKVPRGSPSITANSSAS
ncbi:hypothetical protein D3C87_2172220 [compost metagenome]